MAKNKIKHITIGLILALMLIIFTGCSKNEKYGEEFNYKTDCQYSYDCSVASWRDVQSDLKGQYIYKNNYIYYYDMDSDTFSPLCNKANCMHDKETDDKRKAECNAYASEGEFDYGDVMNNNANIQYYNDYIYYARANSLYRVSKDGSKKDTVFTSDEKLPINYWIIHRGVFYYETEPCYYGKNNNTQVYTKCVIKALSLSNKMKEKNAEIIHKSDEEHTGIGFGHLLAYKDYITFNYIANRKDYVSRSNEDWIMNNTSYTYIYNTNTKDLSLIPVPKGYSKTTCISGIHFLEDKILIKLYDDMKKQSYKLPIYSINYDLTDEKIWLDNTIPQGYNILIYKDYVIFEDVWYMDKLTEKCNYMIYDGNAKKVSEYICPAYKAVEHRGFGPDGVQILFEEIDSGCNIYELDINDLLNLTGQEVKPKLIGKLSYTEE